MQKEPERPNTSIRMSAEVKEKAQIFGIENKLSLGELIEMSLLHFMACADQDKKFLTWIVHKYGKQEGKS